MIRRLVGILSILTAVFFFFSGAALAAEVVLYSSNPSELLDLVSKGFEAKTGIKVSVVRLGTGEAMKRIAAEKDKPLCDVFWSGDVAVLENARRTSSPTGPRRPRDFPPVTWRRRPAGPPATPMS